MERMIIFCMLFFCSSMVLTATPHKAMKYKQLLKTIDQLKDVVKDKDAELLHTPENPVDECLFTAVTCFQKGTLKLQPKNSQVNSTFIKTVNILKRPILKDSGKVGFPDNAHNHDHCSLLSVTNTTYSSETVKAKLVRKTDQSFITLEIRNIHFSALPRETLTLFLSVSGVYAL
ncbi:interleukin-21 isoform X1 [Anas acuta]|uniref:interleukin-21 isoform X1 n=1 Tax=Anas acuta TaxID=28680 RepID=UPI0035C898D4